jgi:protein-S-isoprenylcysteine O-methyltransferase Ste14
MILPMILSAIAALLFLVGIAIEIWAVVTIGWRRAFDLTDAAPDPVLPKLVFRGPFAVVRHPQSLGLLFLLAATPFGLRSFAMAVLALASGAVVVGMAIRNDRELAAQFGPAYERYQRNVPFLVPLLR